MAFGFSQSPWQSGSASTNVIPWQAQTQSPWRQDRATIAAMQPGAGLPSIYLPSEVAEVTPEAASNVPAQMPFGGFMPMPIPMPIPFPMSMGSGGSQMDFVNIPGQGLVPSAQADMGAYAPMQHVGGVTTYGPYVDIGSGFGSWY